jgi:hypothetical protein
MSFHWFGGGGGGCRLLLLAPHLSPDICSSLVFYFRLPFPLPPQSSLVLISFFILFSHISLNVPAGHQEGFDGSRAGGRAQAGARCRARRARRSGSAVAGGRGEVSSIWWFCELVMIFVLILWRTCDYRGDFCCDIMNLWLWFVWWFLWDESSESCCNLLMI